MPQDGSDMEQQKQDGDSAASVSPDTQYADPTEAKPPAEPADTEDTTYAAGTADVEAADDESSEDEEGGPNPQGPSANTMADAPDKDSGFYG